MSITIKTSHYHSSYIKKIFDLVGSIVLFVTALPFILLIVVVANLTEGKPILFIQERVGKNGRVFKIVKFRTMRIGAEKERQQKSLLKLNISDGPTFKIPNDPRYSEFGKYLVKTGLDELPQIINIIKGEMSLVGPRPLPIYEAKKLNKRDKVREYVLPGIVSSWVISGAHNMKFKKWMELDREYVRSGSLIFDIKILIKTIILISKLILRKLAKTSFRYRLIDKK